MHYWTRCYCSGGATCQVKSQPALRNGKGAKDIMQKSRFEYLWLCARYRSQIMIFCLEIAHGLHHRHMLFFIKLFEWILFFKTCWIDHCIHILGHSA